jgi:SAM-dependent methyltransferase
VLDEQFDIVFSSYGALCWLGDLARWASIAARYVKPGGLFYLVEMHPFPAIFASAEADLPGVTFSATHPYTSGSQPRPEDVGATTRDPAHGTVYSWNHGLGEVLTALLGAGLRLEFVHEFPYAHYQRFVALRQRDDGYWHWSDARNTMPLLFSVRATK